VPPVTIQFIIPCNKYSYNTRQIRFNLTLSAFVVIIFIVSSFNAKSASLQNPVGDNRSSPEKPSVKQSSDMNLSTSRIDAVEKSTAGVIENHISMAMYLVSTTTVSSPANITTETSTSNNISATTISERTDKDTTTFQTVSGQNSETITANVKIAN
ncbi:uncharacterized protein LOC113549737, partial [Rhopalosiphum maidis]|uniref:uncharacterized protein LOC113549737 n=1 Tax=Rhopalosiphum maidis TaxID=43146 RepID=UPI000EFDC04C